MATVKKHTYDAKCLELAEYFLASEKIKEGEKVEVTADLAQEIQETVEDFIMIERIAGRWEVEMTIASKT
jgi:hypothetical protein